MKILLFLLLILSGVCVKAQTLKITIYNTTGYSVDDVSLQSISIGHIAKDSSVTLTLKNKEIRIEDGAPFYPNADGKIKELQSDTAQKMYGYCATGSQFVNSGEYKFDLVIHLEKTGYTLWWNPHRK